MWGNGGKKAGYNTIYKVYTSAGILYTSEEIWFVIQHYGPQTKFLVSESKGINFINQLILDDGLESASKFPPTPQEVPWPSE
jgi:hypothetical protein